MGRRRALITGGAGFLGSHLVSRLSDENWHVIVLARPGSERSLPAELYGVPRVEADITALESTVDIPDVDVIFHLAAVGLHERRALPPGEVMRTNVLGTLNVVRLAADRGVRRVVHVGSGHEYGAGSRWRENAPLQPGSAYGASKAAAWILASTLGRLSAVDLVGLRPFTLYGPGDSPYGLVGSAVLACLAHTPLELTEGRQTRDFVYVADAVDALLAASESPLTGEVFNVSTGVETAIRTIVELIAELSETTSDLRFGARPYREDEAWSSSGDPTKARELLGWEAATGLREGVEATLAWFRERRGPVGAEAKS